MLRIIWILTALNSTALVIFIIAMLVMNQDRQVDYMESGWTVIFIIVAVIVILLAALPPRFSRSGFVLVFSLFFALLPAAIATGIYLSGKLSSLKRSKSFASVYYSDSEQREIADAIEQHDTDLVRKLIEGRDLKVQGKRVFDEDGLNYLQFAIRIRSNPISFPFNDEANNSIIRMLVHHGAPVTPALKEATAYLSPAMVGLLLEAGADPDAKRFAGEDALLFRLVGTSPEDIDIAILLIRYGADVNALNSYGQSVLMLAATSAGTTLNWKEAWRLIRYLLEHTDADPDYVRNDGIGFRSIMEKIASDAVSQHLPMPPDYEAVRLWLKDHQTHHSRKEENH